jgi:hypothetical protein
VAILLFLNYRPVFPKYDDAWFFLISYTWNNGLPFSNYWASPISGPNIFNYHGFLQYSLISYLSPCSTLQCTRTGLVIIQVASLLVWIVGVHATGAGRTMRIVLYVLGLTTLLQYSGRPELLASIWMVLLFVAFLRLSEQGHFLTRAAVSGFLVGLVAMTDPAASVTLGLSVAAVIAVWRSNHDGMLALVTELALLGTGAIIAVLLCFWLIYPFSMSDWIWGMKAHGSKIASRTDSADFAKYYVFSRLSPLLAAMFVPLAFLCWVLLAQAGRRGGTSLLVAVAAAAAFLLVLAWTAVRIPATYYNFNVLVPTIGLAATTLLVRHDMARFPRIVVPLSLGAFALASLMALVLVLGDKLYYLPQQGRLAAEIRETVETALKQNLRVAIDTPLIPAIDDIEILKRLDLVFTGQPGKTEGWRPGADILIRGQVEFGTIQPTPEGAVLVSDRFEPEWFNRYVKPESYAYAVYRRTGVQ